MPIILDREQRDAIRDALLTNLSGVGDIHLMLMNEDWARARRFRMEFEDDMRLLDDLGWGEDEPGERFQVTMEPVALRRLTARLHDLASTGVPVPARGLSGDREEPRYGVRRVRRDPRPASQRSRRLMTLRAPLDCWR